MHTHTLNDQLKFTVPPGKRHYSCIIILISGLGSGWVGVWRSERKKAVKKICLEFFIFIQHRLLLGNTYLTAVRHYDENQTSSSHGSTMYLLLCPYKIIYSSALLSSYSNLYTNELLILLIIKYPYFLLLDKCFKCSFNDWNSQCVHY